MFWNGVHDEPKSPLEELFWSPFVNAAQVSVSVRDGIASLTGTVDRWAERQSAVESAFPGGARDVVNLLKVKGGPDELS